MSIKRKVTGLLKETGVLPKIEWPAEWASDEGWPEASSEGRDQIDWGEMERELRKQGTSLDAVARKLGKKLGPPNRT